MPLERSIANMFTGINWSVLNKAAKRDYAKGVDTVLAQRHCDADTQNKLRAEAKRVYDALERLDFEIRRTRKQI